MPLGPPEGVGLQEADPEGWRRLSSRMLLVHPVRTLWSMAFPLLIAIFAGQRGSAQGSNWWLWIAVAGAVVALVAGMMTWFITRYRFTPEQLQLRTGLLSRRTLTAPLDRIRSVDIESTPIHRVLGLAKVAVGTGVDSSRIELDGLTQEQAAELRVYLLERSKEVSASADTQASAAGEAAVADGQPHPDTADGAGADGTGDTTYQGGAERELARINWSWLRFAPFSLSSLVVVAGAVGVLFQFGDDLPIDQLEVAQDAWAWIVAQAVLVLVASLAIVVVIGWVLLSTASYVLNWWNLRLVSEANGNLRVTRGLLTTRSQTIERAKVRGVQMSEPFLLRFVTGAELTAIATGVGGAGTARVLPPAPRKVVEEVGHDLLEEDGPLTMALRGHGPRARRRMHVSHQWGTLFLTALVAVPTYLLPWEFFQGWPWWIPVAVLVGFGLLNAVIAEAGWRNLGHGLTEEHLVVQTGAVVRTREVLERAGIIGWVVHQSFFQRRLGLADLTATTAAGGEQVVAPNMPVELAVDLADRATPGMLTDFTTS
ncbi:PH domain-containing protein [Ornithinimicrobium sp. Y1694]|uniref:PH domain-containing protein n=1 Tax=Ornithinimicrobium sp. Y1694 TaxID=3418590 RepID=UPI003CEA02AB